MTVRPAHASSRAWCAIALGTLAGTLLACSGGGGGDDSDPVTCTNLNFARALATPAAGDVYLEQASASCNSVDVAVLVSNLSGIFTVSFDLAVPSALLSYQSYTTGPLLLKGNPLTPPLVVVTPAAGSVQVTMTRFGPDAPVSASGSEALITLHFTRVGPGAAALDFDTSGGSLVTERILDDNGATLSAVFAPGHGGVVMVP